MRWPAGLLATLALVACSGPSGIQEERARTFHVAGLLFAELGETDLVALEPDTGRARFRYRYEGMPRVPFAKVRTPRLVCPPEASRDRLVLRYEESVHVLSLPGGELLWQRECLPTACPRLCAGLLEDGAVAVVTGSGRALTVLGPDGAPRWTRPLKETAVEAPRFLGGRTVVRTKSALVAFDGAGAVSWQEDLRRGYHDAPAPPGSGPVPSTR